MRAKRWKKLVPVLLAWIVAISGSAVAQDVDWTCDEGANDVLFAAEAAYEAVRDLEGDARVEKLKESFWLSARAEMLCTGNYDRFVDAQKLRVRAATRLANMAQIIANEPGKVDLGDHTLFMICMGEGNPTVIFENGYGAGAGIWENIQPAISTQTRACSYDRWGVGRSVDQPDDIVVTYQDQVNDLLDLLNTAGIAPPYVLVGASRGGLNALLFTDKHPDLVAGLVMVDAWHPETDQRWCEIVPDDCLEGREPDDAGNLENLDVVASNVQVAGIDSVGDLPLVVISAAKKWGYWHADAHQMVLEMHEDYLTFSSNSRHVVLENSDHIVQSGSEVDQVLEAILWVIDEARAAGESD